MFLCPIKYFTIYCFSKKLQDNKYNIFIAEIESNNIFIFLKKIYLNTIFHTPDCGCCWQRVVLVCGVDVSPHPSATLLQGEHSGPSGPQVLHRGRQDQSAAETSSPIRRCARPRLPPFGESLTPLPSNY